MNKQLLPPLSALILVMAAVPVLAKPAVNTSEQQQVVQQLNEAKQIIRNAEYQAEQIIRAAEVKALAIKKQQGDREPLQVQNQKIAVEMNNATLEQIVRAIMPENWRVMVDVKNPGIKARRFQFVSNRSREQALNDLLIPMGMRHQYFFDLRNSQGKVAPLLIVSVKA